MRVLLLSWYFPPTNAIGAVRTGKLARYLLQHGHEVRVVAGRPPELPTTLPLEIPAESVALAGFFDVMAPLRRLDQLRRLFGRGPGGGGGNAGGVAAGDRRRRSGLRTLAGRATDLYAHLVCFPDRHVGWLPAAWRAAHRLQRSWRPDLIYASGPPFTAFVLADRLARAGRGDGRGGIPWVAEFRDRWVDDPYNEYPAWRVAMLQRMERRVLASASGIVTVSQPWADFYRDKFGKPVATIYNGYDPADFAEPEPAPPSANAADALEIVYTGAIYPGRRDPTPLFRAIACLGPDRCAVHVTFVGSAPELVLPVAARCGVADRVSVEPGIPYRQSIARQRCADALLLMQWNDPKEQGNCPAKLFEYLAAQRPVIGLGLEQGVPAQFIRERQAGIFSNDPAAIACQLRRWLAEKRRTGRVADLPAMAREGLSRELQYQRLVTFLEREILGRAPPEPDAGAD